MGTRLEMKVDTPVNLINGKVFSTKSSLAGFRAIHNHVGIGQIHAATMPLNFHAERSPSCDAPTRARAGKKDASRGGSYGRKRKAR